MNGSCHVYPAKGWQLCHVDTNEGERASEAGKVICNQPRLTMAAEALLVRMPHLDWKMESVDDPSASQESLGYCTANPASAYYTAATPHNQSSFDGAGQLVTVSANAFCGQQFIRWKGTGEVYDEGGVVRTDVSLDAGEDEPGRWVTNPNLYIKMTKQDNGHKPADKTPTAVLSTKVPQSQSISWEDHFRPTLVDHWGDKFRHVFHGVFGLLNLPSYAGIIINEDVEFLGSTHDFEAQEVIAMLANSDASVPILDGNYIIDQHALHPYLPRFADLQDGDTITFGQVWKAVMCYGDDPIPPEDIQIVYTFRLIQMEGETRRHFYVQKVGLPCPDHP